MANREKSKQRKKAKQKRRKAKEKTNDSGVFRYCIDALYPEHKCDKPGCPACSDKPATPKTKKGAFAYPDGTFVTFKDRELAKRVVEDMQAQADASDGDSPLDYIYPPNAIFSVGVMRRVKGSPSGAILIHGHKDILTWDMYLEFTNVISSHAYTLEAEADSFLAELELPPETPKKLLKQAARNAVINRSGARFKRRLDKKYREKAINDAMREFDLPRMIAEKAVDDTIEEMRE